MSHESVIFQIGWNACINCGACIAVCPHAPGFVTSFNTIAVNTPCDIACMACEIICPVSTIIHLPQSQLSNDPSFIQLNPRR